MGNGDAKRFSDNSRCSWWSLSCLDWVVEEDVAPFSDEREADDAGLSVRGRQQHPEQRLLDDGAAVLAGPPETSLPDQRRQDRRPESRQEAERLQLPQR